MNKIKAIYDVVKSMRDKKEREGIVQVKVEEDGQQLLKFSNEFQHLVDGHVKCKIQSEWNYEGKEGKHESTTEFKRNGEGRCPFHKRFKHGENGGHGPGFKSKADTILFFLRLLNELKVEEQGENLQFSLVLDDEVKKLKEKMQGKFEKNHSFHHHPLKGLLMEKVLLMEKPQICVNVVANKNKEVEKVTVSLQGTFEKDGQHELNAAFEVHFSK
ncbi:MAG: hypothetical protein Q8934_01550 [Bacillota bacterium]|nr:hypothetical protein [Bacillota bacterium]